MSRALQLSRFLREIQANFGDPQKVKAALSLRFEGCTLPFIARYRRAETGGMSPQSIQSLFQAYDTWNAILSRKKYILNKISGKFIANDQLVSKIRNAETMEELEDLYLPFKTKRCTHATKARNMGLGPLADRLWFSIVNQAKTPSVMDENRFNHEISVLSQSCGRSVKDTKMGVLHLVAQHVADDRRIRTAIRKLLWKRGAVSSKEASVGNCSNCKNWRESSPNPRQTSSKSKKKRKKHSSSRDLQPCKYRDYFHFMAYLSTVKPHQILALNRAVNSKCLRMKIGIGNISDKYATEIEKKNVFRCMCEILGRPTISSQSNKKSGMDRFIKQALEDAWDRLLRPSLLREIKRISTTKAETHAAAVFSRNLKGLLLMPPLRAQQVLGIDPGFRAGCKYAVINKTGRVSSIGNGAASRETEELVTTLIERMGLSSKNSQSNPDILHNPSKLKNISKQLQYTIVNESGASVYSVSPAAREEFPSIDPLHIGAISIARRLVDPLSELLKIDPKAIGVGLYQHDIKSNILSIQVDRVVEACVSAVGVDVNSASVAVLSKVPGINLCRAKAIHEYCTSKPIVCRDDLLNIPGFGKKSFEQAAGFLRIVQPASIQNVPISAAKCFNPLDDSPIHPESYQLASKILESVGIENRQLSVRKYWIEVVTPLLQKMKMSQLKSIAEKNKIDLVTVEDCWRFLQIPGQLADPRRVLAPPLLRTKAKTIQDLKTNDILYGVIRNVVDFGAFIDIGIGTDALLHSRHFKEDVYKEEPKVMDSIDIALTSLEKKQDEAAIKNSFSDISVGNVIKVFVESIDIHRGRISLSLKKHYMGCSTITNMTKNTAAKHKSSNETDKKKWKGKQKLNVDHKRKTNKRKRNESPSSYKKHRKRK